MVRGINVEWPFLKMAIADSKANPADLKFHGLNLIRVNIFDADVSPQTIAELQAYIATTTPLGIILLLEYHEYPGIATGDTLSKVADMYRQLAAAAKGNGYVWFATQNEPSTGGSVSDINNEIHTIYNAVRSTGNNTVILVNPYGGYNPQGTDLSGMANIGWDLHYYAWLPNSGTPLASEVAQAKAVANIPPVIGEYGPASGNGIDSGGSAVVQEVHNSGLSSIAWAWRTQNPGNPAPGDLLYAGWDAAAPLTDFGTQVASHIQQAGTPTPGAYDPQAFSQQTCQLSQVIYPNAVSQAADQLQQAMQQAQDQSAAPAPASSSPTAGPATPQQAPLPTSGPPSDQTASVVAPSPSAAPKPPATPATGQSQAAAVSRPRRPASPLPSLPPDASSNPTLQAEIAAAQSRIAELEAASAAKPLPAIDQSAPTSASSPPSQQSGPAPAAASALSAMMPQPIQPKHKPGRHHQRDTENDNDADDR